jgi:flagellar FliL protein
MNKKFKTVSVFVLVAALSAAVAAGAVWRTTRPAALPSLQPKKAEVAKKPSKYVTLDKVIVMLRRGPNDAESHYLAADLVLATTDEKERQLKDNLPLLRSVAVRTLSAYAMPAAANMTVEQYAAVLNRSFDASYANEKLDKPFSAVMIGKLIIE